jgi:hypothetical protein
MAGGVLPPNIGQDAGGLLPFGPPTGIDASRNAILGYLAGALQGGNLGQSIARGLQGWLTGAQTDATEQARRAAAQYVAQQPGIDPGMRSVLMQNPAFAMQYLQARVSPHTTRDITEYEYAQKQGFKGTLPDFIQRKRAGVPPTQE